MNNTATSRSGHVAPSVNVLGNVLGVLARKGQRGQACLVSPGSNTVQPGKLSDAR